MISVLKAIFAVSLLCVVLSACASASSSDAVPAATLAPVGAPSGTPTAGGTIVNASGISANKPGQVLDVKVGDTFDVRIPTIPRTGFTWQPQKLDTQILEQLGDPRYEPDTSPNSAGGTVVLTFKVVGPGTARLTLIYASAPGGSAPSLYSDSFGITVNAQ